MIRIALLLLAFAAGTTRAQTPSTDIQRPRMGYPNLASLGLTLAGTAFAAAGVSAEAGRWGLWQFAPPEGQATQRPEVQAWQLVRGRSFCQFALYAAMHTTDDARTAFAAEWAQLARARGVPGSAVPASRAAPAPNGWSRQQGEGEEQLASTGSYRVRQATFSGHGRRMSAVVTGNDGQLCGPLADRFFGSLVPLQPQEAAAPPALAPEPAQASGAPALTAQTWMKTAASYSHWGSNFSLAELAKLSGGQGYARRSWQFGADGRYRYRLEVWSMTYKPQELSGIEDTGRWHREGNRIVVEPDRAVAYVEDKQSRTRLREQPAQTARTVYVSQMHYLSGMAAWYLVLAPEDGKPTHREGDFDQQPGFPNAYFYGPPPKVGA